MQVVLFNPELTISLDIFLLNKSYSLFHIATFEEVKNVVIFFSSMYRKFHIENSSASVLGFDKTSIELLTSKQGHNALQSEYEILNATCTVYI